MGMTAYFDVEYTDAALDKARADAKRSGGTVPPRMYLPHLITCQGSILLLSLNERRTTADMIPQQRRKAASTSSSTTM